jgi:hypothetical protein
MAAAGSAGAQDVTVRISTISNQGSGVVTSSPAGINCTLSGQRVAGTCAAPFAAGTLVTLTATPAAHNTFGTWVTSPCPASVPHPR